MLRAYRFSHDPGVPMDDVLARSDAYSAGARPRSRNVGVYVFVSPLASESMELPSPLTRVAEVVSFHRLPDGHPAMPPARARSRVIRIYLSISPGLRLRIRFRRLRNLAGPVARGVSSAKRECSIA